MAENQMPVAEKATIISKAWGLPFEKVREIQRKNVDDCSVWELKVRYNNPNLGKLPEWVDMDAVDTIIWKCVHTRWTSRIRSQYSKEDLHSICWERIFLKTHEIEKVGKDNYQKYIWTIAKNRVDAIVQSFDVHSQYMNFNANVDASIDFESDGNSTIQDNYIIHKERDLLGNIRDVRVEENAEFMTTNQSTPQDDAFDEIDMLLTVKSIEDIMLRDLLSMAAYLIAGMDCFEELYKDAMCRLCKSKQDKIHKMKVARRKVTFKSILNIVAEGVSNQYFDKISDYAQKYLVIT